MSNRNMFSTDVIYHWISEDSDDEMYFFTPDGEGFIFFDTRKEAEEQTGLTTVTIVSDLPDE